MYLVQSFQHYWKAAKLVVGWLQQSPLTTALKAPLQLDSDAVLLLAFPSLVNCCEAVLYA